MERIIDLLSRVADKLAREPVRARLYTLGVAVLGVLASLGYIDPSQVDAYAGVLGYILVVESSRRKVKPLAKVRDGDGHVDPLR